MAILSTAINTSTNATLEDVTLALNVAAPDAQLVFSDSRVVTILAGAAETLVSNFNAGTLAPGDYTATLQVYHDPADVYSEDQTTFAIAPVLSFAGSVAADPQVLQPGAPFTIRYTLSNLGNIDVSAAEARFLIVEPNTGAILNTFSATISVASGQSVSGSVPASSEGLTPGTFAVIFRVAVNSEIHTVARTLFTVEEIPCRYLNFVLFGDDKVDVRGRAETNDVADQDNGDVFSNTRIRLRGRATIRGDAISAGGPRSVIVGRRARVTGTITQDADPIPLPAVDELIDLIAMNNSNDAIGLTDDGEDPLHGTAFELDDDDSITLAPGQYFFTEFEVEGILYVSGPVVVAVRGEAEIDDSARVNPGGDVSNFLLLAAGRAAVCDDEDDDDEGGDEDDDDTGDGDDGDEDDDDDRECRWEGKVDITGESEFFGAVYAPRATIKVEGKAQVTGCLVGGEIRAAGTAEVFYDPGVQRHCRNLPRP